MKELQSAIRAALASSRADYTEIRLEREWRTQVFFQRENLENIESSTEVGGIIRALVDGGWGIVVFNSLDELEKKIEEAYRTAKAVSAKVGEKSVLAPTEPVEDEVRVQLKKDFRQVSLAKKKELIERYNRLMLSVPKVVATATRYTDSFKEWLFANSEGTFIFEERPDITLFLMATAREDGNIQQAFESFGEAQGFELVEGLEQKAEETAKRAVALLSAKPVKGGQYTVILDQELAGVFIHEAFGHLCEADFTYKNERMRELLQPGREFGVKELNVIEDGYLPGRRGNYRYDDEGVPRRRIYLIKSGVLQGLMHSRETAAKLGALPTGNARAISYRFEPIVRMRNTYIDKGSHTFAEMIRGIDHGIYAKSAFGGQTELEQFTFSAAYAYEIEHGEVGEMLRDVVLTGNVFATLKNIDMIGDDLKINGSSGGCGKGGQAPLGVTDGAPHVRIQNVIIGGRA
ncbi:MAG: TldD/PmbA family protein [Candidatus Acetothermia bacterium]|nr:TldD/PmbA family protein [Candidatus Acetothermia bacterium]MDH7505821.1 TldD/PmbA family protein [Candidatus Acetothermia bacterium]